MSRPDGDEIDQRIRENLGLRLIGGHPSEECSLCHLYGMEGVHERSCALRLRRTGDRPAESHTERPWMWA